MIIYVNTCNFSTWPIHELHTCKHHQEKRRNLRFKTGTNLHYFFSCIERGNIKGFTCYVYSTVAHKSYIILIYIFCQKSSTKSPTKKGKKCLPHSLLHTGHNFLKHGEDIIATKPTIESKLFHSVM